MKLALFLFVVLTTGMGFPKAQKENMQASKCRIKCDKDGNSGWVCTSHTGPTAWTSRCYLKCHNRYYRKDQRKEIECEKGTLADCMVNECTLEETRTPFKGEVCRNMDADMCYKKCYPRFFNCTIDESDGKQSVRPTELPVEKGFEED